MGTWWINGELVPDDEASLSITDHGLTVGDGCFETTPCLLYTSDAADE